MKCFFFVLPHCTVYITCAWSTPCLDGWVRVCVCLYVFTYFVASSMVLYAFAVKITGTNRFFCCSRLCKIHWIHCMLKLICIREKFHFIRAHAHAQIFHWCANEINIHILFQRIRWFVDFVSILSKHSIRIRSLDFISCLLLSSRCRFAAKLHISYATFVHKNVS